MTTAVARDARPPLALVRAMNPVMRVVLPTPLGRVVRPFALLEFDGRHTGRRFRVPVVWHVIDDGEIVVSPARWRANFIGGRAATVSHHGRRRRMLGVLEADPAEVTATLQHLADRHGSLRSIGVEVPAGHRLTAADVIAVDRAVIRFTPID